MKFIKRLLYRIFDQRIYFRVVSFLFFILYFSGLLKISKKFKMHYFVSKLIRKGDMIIDIGANFGYYTKIFSRATGIEGIVWAVEPVPLYREILTKNVSGASNIVILPYALGEKESVEYMGIPGDQPYRHGLTRILTADEKDENSSLRVEVKTPSELFGNLDKVDYIKCDIEGYESRVIPGFIDIIKQFRPVIQIEVLPENRRLINDMLFKEGYLAYRAFKNALREIGRSEIYNDDIIYIHRDRDDITRYLINNQSI